VTIVVKSLKAEIEYGNIISVAEHVGMDIIGMLNLMNVNVVEKL
jgi:hypothetical protein